MSQPIFHTVITNPEHGGGLETGSTTHAQTGSRLPPDPGKPSLAQRPCLYLTCFVKSLPVIFISGIVMWSYYAYFVATVLTLMEDRVEKIVSGIMFHLVTVLFLWSYAMIVTTPPGRAPRSWRLTQERLDTLAAAQTEEEWKQILGRETQRLGCEVKQRSVQNAIRYCEKCLCIKPDRSHHCSVCEVCTLKMDHHCPWVNNCVGFANYKFFLLFLGYALTYCIFIAATTARHFINIWLLKKEESGEEEEEGEMQHSAAKYHLLFVFFVSILFSMSISSLFGYHVWLVLHNRTTLEQFRAPMFANNVSDPNVWSLGKMNNLREVFGTSVWTWLIPVKTYLGDGLSFPSRSHGLDIPDYKINGAQDNTAFSSVHHVQETPDRILTNPTLGGGGVISVTDTGSRIIVAGNGIVTDTSDSMVRLDANGLTKTVMVAETDLGVD